MKPPKLAEIAERIGAHLKRFEADPKVNAGGQYRPYNGAHSDVERNHRIIVCYRGYEDSTALTKAEALAYLEWLDAGNVGKHWDAKRKTVGERVRELGC